MPPIKSQRDEVPVMQSGTNTRIEIPKKYVDLFGIQKGSKKTGEGDFFVWEYLPEQDLFHCYLRPRQKQEELSGGAGFASLTQVLGKKESMR